MKKIFCRFAAFALIGSFGGGAVAQSVIDEIVVTARKRSENLQAIPDSVTVIGSELIEAAAISNIKDFSVLVPNLNISTNFRQGLSFVTIRGLITPQVGEAPIAFVVDGVTVPNLEFINQDLDQIERIEVLRGPQGALYGKNAIGGAINIVTRQPAEELEGHLELSYAEGNDVGISASLGGAISDAMRFRLSARYRDFDGLIDNAFLDEKADYVDGAYGLQGMLLIEPDAVSSLALHGRLRDTTQGTNYMSFITVDQIEDFSIGPTQNAVGIDEQEVWTLSAKYDRDLDNGGVLTLIAGLNSSRDDQFSDADFASLPEGPENFFFPSTQINLIEEDSFNIEGRLSSSDDQPLRWLTGLFYETRDRIVQFDQIYDWPGTERVTLADAIPLLVNSNDYDPADIWVTVFPTDGERTNQETSAYAVFGQVNYDVTEAFELTFALRYDSEERDAFDERVRFTADSTISDTFSELQPKLSGAWQVSDNALLSLTWSRGFRSGGFNEYSEFVVRSYEEEISDIFEVGAKTDWMDGRLTLNAAAFMIFQDNAQFTRFNSLTFTLENLNVDEVEVSGFEAELLLRATENLTLRLGLGVIDNEIAANSGLDPYTGLDLAQTVGNTMPYVEDYNFNASLDYGRPLANGLFFDARVSINALGPRSFDIFNDLTGESDGHVFLDAGMGLSTDAWAVSLFASNLADEDAPETVFFYNPLIRFPNQPRQIGIRARYMF